MAILPLLGLLDSNQQFSNSQNIVCDRYTKPQNAVSLGTFL